LDGKTCLIFLTLDQTQEPSEAAHYAEISALATARRAFVALVGTNWLSTMAAEGLGPRPALTRAERRSASVSRFQSSEAIQRRKW
jgi:hypothetical protein